MSNLESHILTDKAQITQAHDAPQHLYCDDKQSLQQVQEKNKSSQAETAKLESSKILPGLELFSSHSEPAPAKGQEHWYSGAARVGKDLGSGALDELKHHPTKLIESAAIGAGAAVAMAALAPEVVTVVAVAGLGYGAYELAKHAGSWVHDASVVAHPEQHGTAEVAKAHAGLHQLGGGATDMAAGIAGGLAAGAAIASFSSEAATAVEGAGSTGTNEATAIEGTSGRGTGAALENSNISGAGSAAEKAGAVPGSNAEVAAVKEPLEVTKPQAPAVEAAKPDPLQEAKIAESVRTNKGIFQSGNDEDAVITAKKQLYDVKFEQVTEDGGRYLQTLENRGQGELIAKGQWIATRLDAEGQPVIEDGMTNSWGMSADKIGNTYQVTPEDLATRTEMVAPTRVDGPTVSMVQLKEPVTIETGWGSMSGKPGDWLANYDYNAATSEAGKNYAIITNKSFGQTYEMVK